MNHNWLLAANDRTLLPCLLLSAGLKEPSGIAQPRTYGSVLFGHGGEVLTRKRPLVAGTELLNQLDEKARGYRHLAFFQGVPESGLEIAQSQPFRYQGWVLGMDGHAPPRTLLDSLAPEEARFVRRNTRGKTVYEAFLNRIMARLVAQGTTAFAQPTAQALVDTIQSVLDETIAADFSQFSLWLSSEHFGVVLSHGTPVQYRRLGGIEHCPRCSEEPVPGSHAGNRVDHLHAEGTLVLGGWQCEDPAWERVPDGKYLIVDRHDEPTILSASAPTSAS